MKLLLAASGPVSASEEKGNVETIRNFHNPNSVFDEIHYVEPPSKARGVDDLGDDIVVHHTYTPIDSGSAGRVLKAFGLFVVALKTAWLVRKHDIDIIRGQSPFKGGFVGVLAQWLTGVPAITSLHNDYDKRQLIEDRYDVFDRPYLTELVERFTIRAASYTFVLTSYLREYAIWHGADQEDTYVLPTHIDPDSFTAEIEEIPATEIPELDVEEDDVVLVFVGRLAGQKDPETLLEGYERAAADNSDLSLVVVGDGPLRPEMEAFVDREGLDDVIFTGFVDRDRVAQIMAAGDAFVFPTRCEGLGFVLMESHAADLPIVTTDIPHTKIVTNEDNALLFEPGDPDGLADCLAEIRDEDRRAELRERGKDALERLSSAHQHDQAEAVFRELVDRRESDAD